MKKAFWILAIAGALATTGCENKTSDDSEEEYEEAEGPSGDSPHVDTNREAFRATGKAAAAIEGKQADRNAAADEALNAGK